MKEDGKHLLDIASIGIAVGALAKVLPAIASLFTIMWLGIRMWESKTIQDLVKRYREWRSR